MHGSYPYEIFPPPGSTSFAPGSCPIAPAPTPPTTGIVAVLKPRKAGTVTKSADLANAHSLNEEGQPERKGESAEERRAELAAIIDWLAVDNPAAGGRREL